jgi:glutamate 5-kinase
MPQITIHLQNAHDHSLLFFNLCRANSCKQRLTQTDPYCQHVATQTRNEHCIASAVPEASLVRHGTPFTVQVPLRGSLVLDAGAVRAVQLHKKSLFAAGIKRVSFSLWYSAWDLKVLFV